MVMKANANIRSCPGTAYQVIGATRAGQRLSVLGRANGWWQVTLGARTGWIWSGLATANVAAQQVREIPAFPPAPLKQAAPAVTPASRPAALPDLVVLGPETQYPVRARVIQGWGYEFVDLSSQYDILVYRDVFGMLAHQIDDENVQRFRRQSRFARSGLIRITLVDAQAHPDPRCPGWGWAPDRDTFVDPYGITQEPCRVEHSLFPQGDSSGTTLLIGWGYKAGTTLAIGAAGPHLGDASTSFFAEALPWPRQPRPGGPAGLQPTAVCAPGDGAQGGWPLGLAGRVCRDRARAALKGARRATDGRSVESHNLTDVSRRNRAAGPLTRAGPPY